MSLFIDVFLALLALAMAHHYDVDTDYSPDDYDDALLKEGTKEKLVSTVLESTVNRTGCTIGNGETYRGTVSTTQSGRTCQKWSEQSPHGHSRTPNNYPDGGLGDHNYCRNPDGEPRPWCYTTDSNKRWEACSIKTCDEQDIEDALTTETNCTSLNGENYRGMVSTTVSGRTCKKWSESPNKGPGEHNFCRNPDNEPGPWCYTTDPDKRWELCSIDTCIDDTLAKNMTALQRIIETKFSGADLNTIKAYCNSDEGTITIFQWELFRNILEEGMFLDTSSRPGAYSWILNNREVLEMFMTSGDVATSFKYALDFLAKLVDQYPAIKESPLKLRIAVATALTFESEVTSLASYHKNIIDGEARYRTYSKWAEDKVLFDTFYEVTAWHLRYVVGSWQETDELIWARENTPEKYASEDQIENVAFEMVEYKTYNDDGISIHDDLAAYYYNKPMSLKNIHEVGAVCGGISKFATGMAQAFGVPALMVGQPGHCAFIVLNNGVWSLRNDISGWGESTTHGGITYTWMKPAYYFSLMNEAQKDLAAFGLSEKIRISSEMANLGPEDTFTILEGASTACPQNLAVWMDLNKTLEEHDLDRTTMQDKFKTVLTVSNNIGKLRTATTDCGRDSIHKLVDGNSSDGSVWICDKSEAIFEIDVGNNSIVDEIVIHWWGKNKAEKIQISSFFVEESTLESCRYGNGETYRGTVSTTQSGRTCQKWSEQSPHGHSRTPNNYPDGGLGDHNYCRNPDGEHSPWCYTTDPYKRFDFCSIESCGEWVQVRTEADETIDTESYYGDLTSRIAGWNKNTMKIRFELGDGVYSASGNSSVYFGIREIEIIGRDRPVDVSTYWEKKTEMTSTNEQIFSVADPDFIICAVDEVQFSWAKDVDKFQVSYGVGNNMTVLIVENGENSANLGGALVSNLKVTAQDSSNSLNDAKIYGFCYSPRSLIQAKVARDIDIGKSEEVVHQLAFVKDYLLETFKDD